MAFSKDRVEDRKRWITAHEEGTYLDNNDKQITYSDFINKELILFSMADIRRSIPAMMDGLKVTQRKIIFSCFKKKDFKEMKVSQ